MTFHCELIDLIENIQEEIAFDLASGISTINNLPFGANDKMDRKKNLKMKKTNKLLLN